MRKAFWLLLFGAALAASSVRVIQVEGGKAFRGPALWPLDL
jgi:hypothetical protein